MAQTLTEGALAMLKTVFQADLPARIALLDAEYGDFAINPIDNSAYYRSDPVAKTVELLPCMFIRPVTWKFQNWGPGETDGQDVILVAVLDHDSDIEQLILRLMRWRRALWEVIQARAESGGLSGWFLYEGPTGDFSPTYRGQSGYIADTKMVLPLEKIEET